MEVAVSKYMYRTQLSLSLAILKSPMTPYWGTLATAVHFEIVAFRAFLIQGFEPLL